MAIRENSLHKVGSLRKNITFGIVYQSVFYQRSIYNTRCKNISEIIRLVYNGQPKSWFIMVSHKERVQRLSAQWRLDVLVHGLEFTAVSHDSPYQDANGSSMKG